MNSFEKNLMSIVLTILLDILSFDANKLEVLVGIDSTRAPENGSSSPFIVAYIGLFMGFRGIVNTIIIQN
jgi:hypothetical protein